MRRWLHEGLNTSAQVRGYCPSKTAQMQFLNHCEILNRITLRTAIRRTRVRPSRLIFKVVGRHLFQNLYPFFF